jgi:hypothetical protein
MAVALLDLAEMGMLTRHFTCEEALFFLHSLCRRSKEIVLLQQKQWVPRTAAWELPKTLRRVQHQYGGFNQDRELRCMELFVRLLHELHTTHVVQFSTSAKQEERCLLGFTSINIGEHMLPVFRDRCLQLVQQEAAFSDPDLKFFSVRENFSVQDECEYTVHTSVCCAYSCVCQLLKVHGLTPHLECKIPDDDQDLPFTELLWFSSWRFNHTAILLGPSFRSPILSPARVAGDERRIPHPFPIEVTGDEAPTLSGVWWADGERRSPYPFPT